MESLSKRLPVYMLATGTTAALGWIVAGISDDNTVPYVDGVVRTLAWITLLAAGTLFIFGGALAGIGALRWKRSSPVLGARHQAPRTHHVRR